MISFNVRIIPPTNCLVSSSTIPPSPLPLFFTSKSVESIIDCKLSFVKFINKSSSNDEFISNDDDDDDDEDDRIVSTT